MNVKKLNLFSKGIDELLDFVKVSSFNNDRVTVTYFNANSFNLLEDRPELDKIFSKINLIHPDGIGVFLASKFLYGKNGFTKRINGSDFYIELIKESLKNNWSSFSLAIQMKL